MQIKVGTLITALILFLVQFYSLSLDFCVDNSVKRVEKYSNYFCRQYEEIQPPTYDNNVNMEKQEQELEMKENVAYGPVQ